MVPVKPVLVKKTRSFPNLKCIFIDPAKLQRDFKTHEKHLSDTQTRIRYDTLKERYEYRIQNTSQFVHVNVCVRVNK